MYDIKLEGGAAVCSMTEGHGGISTETIIDGGTKI